jgi:hypothetical protein
LAAALVVTALFILPITVRNALVYRAFLPLNSNAGFAIYSANHPNQGVHFDQDYVAPLPNLDPSEWNYTWPNEAQWNSILIKETVRFVVEDPQRYLLLTLSRVPVFFNFWFSAESNLTGDLMRVLCFGLYLPFFIYGLLASRSIWKQASLIYLFALLYSAIHILTWASVRYRLPVDAALMPFAAYGILNLAGRFRFVQVLFPRVYMVSKKEEIA